jgi:hypothetical protein
MFKHHPDGKIYINGFVCTLEEFLTQRPDYLLPDQIKVSTYDGLSHRLWDNDDNQSGGPVPWEEGDEYLANAEAIEAAILASRESPPLTLEQEKNRKCVEIDNRTQELIHEGSS